MAPIRVLIVDDSCLAQELISSVLSVDKQIQIVGQATNGREAIEKTRGLKPDIVLMDIEMPVMNGIEAIEHIMATNAVPILVVTAQSDAHTAYTAISKGALDLIPKPDVNLNSSHEFIRKVKLLSEIKVITHIKGKQALNIPLRPMALDKHSDRIIAIASSTGGPRALLTIFSTLPGDLPCPIVVAQHIPDGFAKGLADWFSRSSQLHLKLAEQGESLQAGVIYISPSESNMEVNSAKRISLVERDPGDIYRPSCDILLSSAARIYGNKSIGIILTGMGHDGTAGIKNIYKAGGLTIAQDETTSSIFGMNKVAIESGCISKILTIDEIAIEVLRILSI
ncbi:MAG TPA: chemotaxis response regulator protein-glutamate methylesterase [Nitrospiraceae bacterium]|jgi:two-component system chemotaxis response regulator CheB|nr:chemotaxis response regulator protein-glutamate methylesterase [Nitrospiraceae bacterium]